MAEMMPAGSEVMPLRPADVSYEIELDDPPEPGPPVLVEPPQPAVHRLPVVPAALASPAAFRRAVVMHGGRAAHAGAYHGIRAPAYLARTVLYALGGIVIVAARHLRWWFVLEQQALRSKAVRDGDAKAWMALHEAAARSRKTRGIITAACLAVLAAGCVALALQPWWAWAVAVAAVLPFLAWAGQAEGPAHHRPGNGDAPVPQTERRHRPARLLRGRARPPGQAGDAGHVRQHDGP